MARASKSGENTVSLFPFLAVLVCVMGSLIFLLLATTKRMHDIAVAEAAAKLQAAQPRPLEPSPVPVDPELSAIDLPAPELGPSTDPVSVPTYPAAPAEDPEHERQRQRLAQEWTAKLAKLERRRDELHEALNKQQLHHQAAKTKVDALEGSIGHSETRLRGVLAEIEAVQQEVVKTENLADLERQIIELRRRLRQLVNRPTPGQTKYAVIPFDVRSGTTRRPILIECTDEGLRFLPEDIVIRPSDLEGFTDQYNPLLAGAMALSTYWTSWNMRQPNPDDKPEPYVLLIVRPNGTVAYYVAMQMLRTLKQPHGYELVDDSIELQPPPVDPQAQKVCQEAIDRQLAERTEVMQHVRNGFRQGNFAGASSGRKGKSQAKAADKFEVADVLPQGTTTAGERSWESMERFEGRKPGAPASSAAPRTPERSAKQAGNRPPAAARKPTSVNPPANEKLTGRDEPPQELAEMDEDQALPAAASDQAARAAGGRQPNRSSVPPEEAFPPETPARSGGGRSAATPRRNAGGRAGGSGQAGGDLHLAQLGRRHWGQSEPGASIGIEQDVTIRVDGKQMVVADEHVVRYVQGEGSTDLFLRVMEAVDAEARNWGRPRSGFYWTPRLQFVISPGGNQMFERIHPLAGRSGLSTTQKFTLDGVAPVKSEDQR